MQHNTKYLVLGAAMAALGIGAISAAHAQSAAPAGSNETSAGGTASSSSNDSSPAGRWHGRGQWGPGGGWDRERGGDRGHRPGDRAQWNFRRGGWRGPHGRRGPGMRGGRGPMLVAVLLRQVRELDLSDQQRQRVRDIFAGVRKQRQSGAARAPLDIAVLGDPGSPGYATAVQEAKNRAVERIQRQSELETQVYDVLTPVQKRELATLLAADQVRMQARRERMQEMRQRMQQRRQQHGSGGPGGGPGSPS